MISVKQFNFPTFQEWIKQNSFWDDWVGKYHIVIEKWSKEYSLDGAYKKTTYGCGIAANVDYPLNVYVETLFSRFFKYNQNDDIKVLKEWYEDTVNQAKEFWEKYVTETFIETSE